MSDSSCLLLVVNAMRVPQARELLERQLQICREELQFGFRGRGGVVSLVFEAARFKAQGQIESRWLSADDLDAAAIDWLMLTHQGFEIFGSVRVAGERRLYELSLIAYPTFDAAFPVSLLVNLDSSLYDAVYGEDDAFDAQAARSLAGLAVRLGANRPAEGFMLTLAGTLADVRPFRTQALLESMRGPASIAHSIPAAALPYGLVIGIEAGRIDALSLSPAWDGRVLQTISGFTVLDNFVSDDDLDNDEDPEVDSVG